MLGIPFLLTLYCVIILTGMCHIKAKVNFTLFEIMHQLKSITANWTNIPALTLYPAIRPNLSYSKALRFYS